MSSRHAAARGVSLIELLVVLWVTGLVTTLVTVCLSTFLRMDRAARDDAALAGTLTALELQLRRDLHAATAAQIDGQTLELEIGEQQIVWQPDGAGFKREVYQGLVQARERWSFPSAREATWSQQELDGRIWLTLDLNLASRNDNRFVPPQRKVSIVGELGRHGRMSPEAAP
jgi:type II secretory pathway component PulJ